MTDHPDDLDESTLFGSRRPRPVVPAAESTDIEDTVLGQRRRAVRVSVPEDAPLGEGEDTVLSSRPREVAEDAHADGEDHTVLSAGRRGASRAIPDETLLSSRRRGSDTDGGSDDDTIAVPRRRTGIDPSAPAGDDDPILRWSQVSSNDERRPATPQRTPTEPLVDDQVRRRVASTPEPAILRAPYRPRVIDAAPVNRLEPVVRELREPVSTAAADARRRADSRRTLIAVIAVGGLIALAGIAGIVALLTGLL